jgi:hypothetical protein
VPIKYSNTPQINYGRQTTNPWSRFPAHARPITSAPTLGSQAIRVYDPSGKPHWALWHCSAWRGLSPRRDSKTGAVTWAMDGSLINQAVAWSS